MSEGMMAKAGATPADAAAGHTAPEAIVAPASSIGCSGAGEWQLNSTNLFSSRAGHASLVRAQVYTKAYRLYRSALTEGGNRLTIAHGDQSVLLDGGGSGLGARHKQNVEEVGTRHIVLFVVKFGKQWLKTASEPLSIYI
jgi:hypothetical protein